MQTVTQTLSWHVAQASPLRPSVNDFELLGSFRLGTPVSSGTIIAVGNGKAYVGKSSSWAEYAIPETLGATLLTAPVAPRVGAAQNLTPGYTQITEPTCYGAMVESGKLLYTMQTYYNAPSTDKPCIGWGEHGLWQLEGHSQGQAGHISRIPEPWASQRGYKYFCGLAGVAIHAAASHGPCATLFNFDPANPPSVETVIPTNKALFYPSSAKFPSWTDVDFIRGAAWTSNGLYFFGRHGIGEIWYGGGTSPNGKIDTCNGNKGFHAESYTPWVWVFNPATLAFTEEGPGPFAKTLWKNPDVAEPCRYIMSASIDGDKLYVLGFDWRATQLNPYANQPAVYVFKVK